MIHSRRMWLLSDDDYARLKNQQRQIAPEVELKKHSVQFVQDKQKQKNASEGLWSHLGDKIRPLISSTGVQNNQQTNLRTHQRQQEDQQQQQQQQQQHQAGDDPAVVLRLINEKVGLRNVSKAMRLYSVIQSEPNIRITANHIFVGEEPTSASTVDIFDALIRPHKTLKLEIDDLLYALAGNPNILTVISNKAAREKILDALESGLGASGVTSTPTSSPKLPPILFKKKRRSRSPLSRSLDYKTADEDSELFLDIPKDSTPESRQKKGSGIKRRGNWLSLF